ncbi:unnamed protein product [Paramecium pentaurelia]|uniref:Homeodomain protein n=1 Tax=Paramecium pentaurelia TaxID=43138 RepID=A0A8S1S1I2_9CILI|nr:unnamed protein product [Paramecium pentaurelia]
MDHLSSIQNNNLPEDNPIGLDKNKTESGNLSKYSRRSWSQQEDDQLKQAIKLYGTNWLIVAPALQNRNPSQCAQRWKRIKPNNVFRKRQSWTQKEDQLLLRLVELHKKNWVQIAKKIPNRTSKQVRERYVNNLNPEINQEPFTDAEDNRIVEGYMNYGSQWCKISKMLQGRPVYNKNIQENVIKNRFYSYLRKKYLKIENPYYVIPQKNQEFSFSNTSKVRHNQSKKKKLLNKVQYNINPKISQQLEKIEDNNYQIGISQFKNVINEQDKISKNAQNIVQKKPSQASNDDQYQEYYSDHKRKQKVKEVSNESFDLVKEEEQQQNYYYYATPNFENIEQLSANFYSTSYAFNTIQPNKIMYCYQPQFETPYVPPYIMTNPIIQYGVASQETLLQRSQDIQKKYLSQ